MQRAQMPKIVEDLSKKMVFIAGPRQCGKTWLSKSIGQQFKKTLYLNYDSMEDRKIIEQKNWSPTTELLIFDELHKSRRWKNYLKGLYDTKPASQKIMVTGSARLDLFRQAGDSLAGRYFLHHLLPFSPAELYQIQEPVDLERLITRSGFPEPFLAATDADAARWRLHYTENLIYEDILHFETVQHIQHIKTVFELLREKVASPVSYSSLSEDIGISVPTVKRYIDILEALYIIFRVPPHAKNIARGLSKMPKIYFYDTGLVKGDEGGRFENFVATCLLKQALAKRDYQGVACQLCYLRTKEKREVDFALIEEGKVTQLIETKLRDTGIAPALQWFMKNYPAPEAIQLIKHLRNPQKSGNIAIPDSLEYLQTLIL